MDHCRSFLRGLKIGVLASPLLGILSIMFLLKFNPREVHSEVGWDLPIAETMFWFPTSASIGALIGAIADARRDRQTPQIITVCLLLLIVLPMTIFSTALWFVRLFGPGWLYEHGLYFGP